MPTFKEGDPVKHISGGPLMTVRAAQANDRYTVNWFDGTKLQMAVFHVGELYSAGGVAPTYDCDMVRVDRLG